jgi:hypothetical protein
VARVSCECVSVGQGRAGSRLGSGLHFFRLACNSPEAEQARASRTAAGQGITAACEFFMPAVAQSRTAISNSLLRTRSQNFWPSSQAAHCSVSRPALFVCRCPARALNSNVAVTWKLRLIFACPTVPARL